MLHAHAIAAPTKKQVMVARMCAHASLKEAPRNVPWLHPTVKPCWVLLPNEVLLDGEAEPGIV